MKFTRKINGNRPLFFASRCAFALKRICASRGRRCAFAHLANIDAQMRIEHDMLDVENLKSFDTNTPDPTLPKKCILMNLQ